MLKVSAMASHQQQSSSINSSAVFANERSPSISDSSDEDEDESDHESVGSSAMEYILRTKRNELTSKIMLSSADGLGNDLRRMDPETQARLEALLEAAGVGNLADGNAFTDPEVLRRLTSSVSCALDEAAAALTRMRAQKSAIPCSSNHGAADSGARSLAEACLEGDVNAVRKLLEEGWSVHEPTDDGESLLSLACSAGYSELAQVLLAMSANVDDRGSKGDCTPLMEAASGGYVDIVRLLLEHGADVNAQSQAGNTALIYACCGGYEEVVEMLVSTGAEIEAHNENGHTPLMEASSGGHVGVARMLLDQGACINSHSNEFKESALTLACYKGHLDMVKFLLDAGADQDHKTDEMHTALMEASMDGHVEVARLLLDHGAQVNMPADSFESPLTLAACGGHVELAALLIERGAYLEEVNDEGYTPLMEAAREGHLEMVSLLLEHGADIHAQTEETQETALSLACCGGFQDVAAFLLQAGADIEQGSSTPLMEASQEGHVDLVKFLLEQFANVNATTATGDTALSFACENGHTDVADVLLATEAVLEHESEGGRTPLMKAARAGHLCTVQFLISRGADVNRQTTNNDHTVLSLACAGGHLAVVELLLAHGAEPSHKLKDNSSMLIEAAKGGNAAVVCFLLENSIPPNPPDLSLASLPTPMTTPTVPPPRVPPVHATQPPVLEHPDFPDVNFPPSLSAQLSTLSSQLSQCPVAPPTSPLIDSPKLLLPDMPITSSAPSSMMSSISQSLSDMSCCGTQVTSTAVQTDTKGINEKLSVIQGKLAKALKNAPFDSSLLSNQLLQTMANEWTDVDADDVPIPPSPFSLPTNNSGGIPIDDQGDSEGLMVAEPAQTLHDTIGDIFYEECEGSDSCPETPPDLSISSVPLTPTPSPASPQFTPVVDIDQQTDSNHDTALTLAAAGGHDELVQLLLTKGSAIEHRDKKGCTSLILAATAGHASTVEILLDHGADIEAQSDRTKDTALSLACSGGRQEVVELLIAKGANFEHRNVSDYTPLSLAASGGYVGIIKLLLGHGAEINSRTGSKLGISPLMLAAMNGHTSAVKLLLDMGSDINAQIETNRNTALTLACFQGRHEVVNLLVDRKANIEHRAKTGLTPLMEAASGGYVEVGRILLDKGADVNAPPVPSSKDTALTIAADKGHYKFCELLLLRGAMVDVKNKKGNSPLWLAANGGHLEVCQLLFSYGADVDSHDNRKVSILMAAFRKGHVKVVKCLVKLVHQFPSDTDCTRFISTIAEKDILKKCHQCMEIIVTAKDRQAAEANKNASILLEELDQEKEREEQKKQAAARKRDRKKQKKKKKLQAEKETEVTNKKNKAVSGDMDDLDDDEKENGDTGDSSSPEPILSKSAVIDSTSVTGIRERKSSTGSLDTLTTIAITAALPTSTAESIDQISVFTTAEMTKAVASTIVTQASSTHSQLSPITVATAAAQCLAVTLTTSSTTIKVSHNLPSPKKGKRHEDGWKEVVRRSKKMSVPSSVISRVIGRGGCNINAIRDTTGAHIDIDTNRQKTTGSCIVTIKGPADATRQAHQLISALIKDPECDINDVLPKRKSPLSLASRAVTTTTSVLSTISSVCFTYSQLSSSSARHTESSNISSAAKTPIASSSIVPQAHLPSGGKPIAQSSGVHHHQSRSVTKGQTAVSTPSIPRASYLPVTSASKPHAPGTAQWASALQTSGNPRKKVSGTIPSIQTASGPTVATVTTSTATTRKTSGGTAVSSSIGSGSSPPIKPVTPAKRQLFPDTPTTRHQLSAGKTLVSVPVTGNCKAPCSMSYSSVAMAAPGSGTKTGGVVSGQLSPTSTSSISVTTATVTTSAALPAALSSFLSNVGQTLSPSVWNDIAHPSNRPSALLPEFEPPCSTSTADPITQPLYITTPGALFTPLPHEVNSSPPHTTSGSPVPNSGPSTSSSPSPSHIGPPLAPGSVSLVDSMEKPTLRPIGTELAWRRATASPLPSMPGISPLISSDGAPPAAVWSYSYPPDPSVPSGWSRAPVASGPSQLMVVGERVSGTSPVPDREQYRASQGETLQSFLERLSLQSHLGLFQQNEIDLDALMLMSEKDYADIGLPEGPRVQLLKSTGRMYAAEMSEYSGPPSGTPPSNRHVARNHPPTWNHQGPVVTTIAGMSNNLGVSYGAKRTGNRDIDPNKSQSWKAWSRTSI